jgi:hypothetical protein
MMTRTLSTVQTDILQRLISGETLALHHGMYSNTWRFGKSGSTAPKSAVNGLVKRKLIERDQDTYDGWIISEAGLSALGIRRTERTDPAAE